MFKVAIAFATLAVAMGAPEADAHYAPALYNAYPNWPGVATPYYSSTCFGCRGKRSADAEADAYYGYPGYGFGYGYGYPAYGYGHATSFEARSPQGLRGKRSAEAYGYGYAPFAYHYGPGIAGHPGAATSFVARSPQGLRGKRSADAEAHYGYPAYGHGYGHHAGGFTQAHGLGYGYAYGLGK